MHMMQTIAKTRLVVVGDPDGQSRAVASFADRHPDWSIVHAASDLAAIAEICRGEASAVLAAAKGSSKRIGAIVGGLREAADSQARIILSCGPEAEPMARAAVREAGADDYLVYPLEVAELETALGVDAPALEATASPAPGINEVALISEAFAALGERPVEALQKLAEMIRAALGATGVTLSLPGVGVTSGEPVRKAVLAVSIGHGAGDERAAATDAHARSGSLALGEKTHGPYGPADVEKLSHYAGLIAQMLAAARREQHWRSLAHTDPGSGLPNRRHLDEQLPAILDRARREQFPVTLLLFDVDNFKTFNDQHGHDAGDEILRIVGQLFRKTCREQDIVTRYGGDEFAVVFWDPAGPREPGSRHPQQALFLVDRFTQALRGQKFSRLGPEGGKVTISGGLATFPWDAGNAEQLLLRADQALLAAKRAGKNRVVVVGA